MRRLAGLGELLVDGVEALVLSALGLGPHRARTRPRPAATPSTPAILESTL